MAVLGLFAVLSWDSALPNQRDVLVLGPLPVRMRTIVLAKLAAMGSAVGLAVLVLNVFTGLGYPLAIGLVSGGLLGIARSFAAYWATMWAATAFMFGWVLAVQGIAAQMFSRQRFLRFSSALQLAAVCLILAVYFLQPPLATPAALAKPENAELATWLPSYWFVGLFQQLANWGMHLIPEAPRSSIRALEDYSRTLGSFKSASPSGFKVSRCRPPAGRNERRL